MTSLRMLGAAVAMTITIGGLAIGCGAPSTPTPTATPTPVLVSPAAPTPKPTPTIVTRPTPTGAPRHPIAMTTCTNRPGTWITTPTNFSANRIAYATGTSPAAVRAGQAGFANCEKPVRVDEIGTDNPPIVAVTDKGKHCLAVGTQQDPRTIVTTKDVLVVCPKE